MMISSQKNFLRIAIFALCLASAGCNNTPWYKISKNKGETEVPTKVKGDLFASEVGSTAKYHDKDIVIMENYFSAAGNDCLAYAEPENLAKKRVVCRDNKGITTEYKYLK